MKTEVVKIDPIDVDASLSHLARAASIIRDGGLVIFPTETVYGLGADATSAEAAGKIYAAKGRPSDNPLIIHVSAPHEAERYAYTNDLYYRLAELYMPGPLTVILNSRPTIPDATRAGLDTVAVRCPSHPIANKLIELSGTPIAAPSANLSGSPSPTTAEHVISDMNGRIDAIIDGGSSEIGLESTIVKLEGDTAIMLRPGAVTCDALGCVCEKVEIAAAVTELLGENERPLSPGMKYKHYAPASPLVLLEGEDSAVTDFLIAAQSQENCAILCYSEEKPLLNDKNIIDVGARDDLAVQAQTLFAALRNTNSMGVDVIYAHLPTQSGIGLALYNRLIRAASHTIKHID